MTQLEQQIDAFIKRLKDDERLKECVFRDAFEKTAAPNPLSRFLITAGVESTKVSDLCIGDLFFDNVKGKAVDATLLFRVYAPVESNGKSLTVMCMRLLESIMKNGGEITAGGSISGVAYDASMRTVYRDVRTVIGYAECYEEDET